MHLFVYIKTGVAGHIPIKCPTKQQTRIYMKTVVGLYDTLTEAQQAWEALSGSGFDERDLSVIAHNGDGVVGDVNEDTTDATAAGATGGAVVGGALGILAGFAALAIPGVGPALVAGPIIGGLIGAGTGALSGGLVGSLVDAGVAEEDAAVYWEGVRRGGALVVVNTAGDPADTDAAAAILKNNGAVDIKERGVAWRTKGWQGYQQNAAPYSTEELDLHRQPPVRDVNEEGSLAEHELAPGELSGQYVDLMKMDVTGGQRPRENEQPDDLDNAHNFEPSASEQRINEAEDEKKTW
jgi:hypothetical protein